MNIIWTILFIISLIILLINNPQIALSSLLNGSENAIILSAKLLSIYAVWLGLLQIVEDTKLNEKISKILKPIINYLFPNVNKNDINFISINLTSNILGMGNASTPSGINAMQSMGKSNSVITTNMIMLLILNTTNLQIIPTTIISLRILYGSIKPTIIILPTIITSLICVSIGIICVKILSKIFKSKKL